MMRSPGRAEAIESARPSGTTPTPVVVMKMRSPLPRSTTLVSPVTSFTPASSHARRIDATMRWRSVSARPSSRMNAAERKSGVAPPTARSLTVPLTARLPMSPPGKKMGRTTKASVVIAMRAPPARTVAASSSTAAALSENAGTKSRPTRSAVRRPPLPWPSTTCSYCPKGTGQAPKGQTSEASDASPVMSDRVLLPARDVDQVPEDVEERRVHLLDAVGAEALDHERVVAHAWHLAAVAPREADGDEAHLARRLERPDHARRFSARRDAQRDVPRPGEHAELAGESAREVLVVGDRREQGSVERERD